MNHSKRKYTIGIDIGGTKILVALLNNDFKIVSEIKNKTKPEKGLDFFLKTIAEGVAYVLRDAHISLKDVLAAGAGCPGFINPQSGVIATSPNIPFLKGVPLGRRIAERIGRPVTIANDVQTGLYGEHQFGAAKGYRDVVGIFMGTGVGGALILDNRLYRGAFGSAGEIGHMQVDPFGPLCGCGHRGCLEAFTGRLAISAEAAVAVARQKAPHLAQETGSDIRQIKSGALARAIKAGDRSIEELLRQKARLIGSAMASLVHIINPEIIILGGGVVEALPGLIVREAEHAMREQAIPAIARPVKVLASRLKDDSIVMGAAKRALDEFGEKGKSA